MKKILILLAVCVSMTAFAQKTEIPEAPYLPIDERTNLVTYQDVVKQEGTPKVLYDRAMNWVKKYYKNTAEVIKSTDPVCCQDFCHRLADHLFRFSRRGNIIILKQRKVGFGKIFS